MLARHPRPGFGAEFLACFEDQARRKPDSAAAAATRGQEPGRNEFRYGGMNRVLGIWSASTPPSTTRVEPVT